MISDVSKAILTGDCNAFDALVKGGLDVNQRTESDRWNFLHKALVSVVLPPNPEMIRHLIDVGVDVNARDSKMWTPLHFAVRTKNSLVVKMLLDAGAEVDAVNDEGISPLHQCLLEQPCNIEVAQMLLAAGADPDNDRGGGTVRNYADATFDPDSDAIRELLDKYTKK